MAATVVPMNTEAAAQNSVNRQLYATVVADNTAAPGRSIGQLGAESSGMVDGPTGETRFTVAGTAAGCQRFGWLSAAAADTIPGECGARLRFAGRI